MPESFNLDPPPGFLDFDPNGEIEFYLRKMPHWRQHGATYFVTFRTADSLPKNKLEELEKLRQTMLGKSGSLPSDSDAKRQSREILRRIERWLDRGYGECKLQEPQLRMLVDSAIQHFAGIRFCLGCYVVMPNHVHAVVQPTEPKMHSLEKILQSIKRFSSQQINQKLNRTGAFWQDESFDHVVRNAEHLYRVVDYIRKNPIKANLPNDSYSFWINPDWQAAGW